MGRFPLRLRLLLLPIIVLAALLPARDARAWSFAVCGDSRNDRHGILTKIAAAVQDSLAEFLLHTGDLEEDGSEAQWTRFRERTKVLKKPLRLVIGNHELYGGGTRERFVRYFGLPDTNHAFDHRDAHVAVIDTAGGTLSDETIGWLDRDLGKHPKGRDGVRHLIVATHAPPRTDNINPHAMSGDHSAASAKLLSVLKRHGVSLVLCGHEHMNLVDDWDGVKVVVSGGAGAPMVPFHRFGYYEIDLSGNVPVETFREIKAGN